MLLNFAGTLPAPATIHTIKVDLLLTPKGATSPTSDSTWFDATEGSDIKLPASATLVIRGGEGNLAVSARALDKDANIIGIGVGGGQVTKNQTATIEVRFSDTARDGRDGGTSAGDTGTVGTGGQAGGGTGGSTGSGGSAAGGQIGSGTGGAGNTGVYRLTLSASSLDFGAVAIGTVSPIQSLTVSNTGTAPSPTLQVFVSDGPHFPLKPGGCSGLVLKPAETCTVSFTFVPNTAGGLQTSGNVGPSSGPKVPFTLTGTGNAGPQALALVPSTLDFNIVDVGSAPSVPFTLTNNGSNPVTNPSIQVIGSSYFQVTDNQCASGSLGTRGRCTFAIAFAPADFGPANATVSVVDPIGGGKPGPSSVTGIGRKTAQLQIQFAGLGGGAITWQGANIHSSSTFSTGIDLVDPTNIPKLVLTATPDPGSRFGGWNGDCMGTDTCSLSMRANHTVTAAFVSLLDSPSPPGLGL